MYKIFKRFKKIENKITDLVITIFKVPVSKKSVILQSLIDLFRKFSYFKAMRLRNFFFNIFYKHLT